MISRLLEPESLAWKVFQLYHLSQGSQVQPLGYGASILFSSLSTDQLQLPAQMSAYMAAFRALHPHRLQPVTAMLPLDILNEPYLGLFSSSSSGRFLSLLPTQLQPTLPAQLLHS